MSCRVVSHNSIDRMRIKFNLIKISMLIELKTLLIVVRCVPFRFFHVSNSRLREGCGGHKIWMFIKSISNKIKISVYYLFSGTERTRKRQKRKRYDTTFELFASKSKCYLLTKNLICVLPYLDWVALNRRARCARTHEIIQRSKGRKNEMTFQLSSPF